MNTERIERLRGFLADGRIIRGKWIGTDAQGRETVCLLAALSPEAAEDRDASACPSDVMPAWLAHMTPWLDDAPSRMAWPGIIRRYADIAGRWHVLDDAAWPRAEYRVRAACVREVMQHTSDNIVLAACERVAALCEAVAAGEPIDHAAFEEARAVSRAVTVEAMRATTVTAAARATGVWAVWATQTQAAADRIAIATLDAIEVEIHRSAANG